MSSPLLLQGIRQKPSQALRAKPETRGHAEWKIRETERELESLPGALIAY
jgi:hypothetical protein